MIDARLKRCLFGALFLALAAPSQAKLLESDVVEPELEAAWDMVFVAEGYLRGEEAEFLADARRLVRDLRRSAAAKPIRDALAINAHFVFVAGRARVAWRPDGAPGSTPVRAWVDEDGVLSTDDALAVRFAPDVDSLVVVARLAGADALDLGALGDLAEVVSHPDEVRASADLPGDGGRLRLPSHDPEAFVHELGHALFGLGDEYEDDPGAIPDDERWQIAETPNLSVDPTGARWARVVPTALEGGGYYAKGVYRPEARCRMRETRSQRFCAVCVDVIAGTPALDEPAAPRLLRPTDGAQLLPGAALEARWRAAEDPTYFAVELHRAGAGPDDEPLWDAWVEGHLRRLPVAVPARAGRYELRVTAVNALGWSSDAAAATLQRTRRRVLTAGITGALDGAGAPEDGRRERR